MNHNKWRGCSTKWNETLLCTRLEEEEEDSFVLSLEWKRWKTEGSVGSLSKEETKSIVLGNVGKDIVGMGFHVSREEEVSEDATAKPFQVQRSKLRTSSSLHLILFRSDGRYSHGILSDGVEGEAEECRIEWMEDKISKSKHLVSASTDGVSSVATLDAKGNVRLYAKLEEGRLHDVRFRMVQLIPYPLRNKRPISEQGFVLSHDGDVAWCDGLQGNMWISLTPRMDPQDPLPCKRDLLDVSPSLRWMFGASMKWIGCAWIDLPGPSIGLMVGTSDGRLIMAKKRKEGCLGDWKCVLRTNETFLSLRDDGTAIDVHGKEHAVPYSSVFLGDCTKDVDGIEFTDIHHMRIDGDRRQDEMKRGSGAPPIDVVRDIYLTLYAHGTPDGSIDTRSALDTEGFACFCRDCYNGQDMSIVLKNLALLGDQERCILLLRNLDADPTLQELEALHALPPTLSSAEVLRAAWDPKADMRGVDHQMFLPKEDQCNNRTEGPATSGFVAIPTIVPAEKRGAKRAQKQKSSSWVRWVESRVMSVEHATGDVELALNELRACRKVIQEIDKEMLEDLSPLDRLEQLLLMLKVLTSVPPRDWASPDVRALFLTSMHHLHPTRPHGRGRYPADDLGGNFSVWNMSIAELAGMDSLYQIGLLLLHGAPEGMRSVVAMLEEDPSLLSGLGDLLVESAEDCSPPMAIWFGKIIGYLDRLVNEDGGSLHKHPSIGTHSDQHKRDKHGSIQCLIPIVGRQVMQTILRVPDTSSWSNCFLFASHAWPVKSVDEDLWRVACIGEALSKAGSTLNWDAVHRATHDADATLEIVADMLANETATDPNTWLCKWLHIAPICQVFGEGLVVRLAELFLRYGCQMSLTLAKILTGLSGNLRITYSSPHEEAAAKAIQIALEKAPDSRARALFEGFQQLAYREDATLDTMLHSHAILKLLLDSTLETDVNENIQLWHELARREGGIMDALCTILPQAGTVLSPLAWRLCEESTMSKYPDSCADRAAAAISLLVSCCPCAGSDVLCSAVIAMGLEADAGGKERVMQYIRHLVAERDGDPLVAADLAREGYTPVWKLCIRLAQESIPAVGAELRALAVGCCPRTEIRSCLKKLQEGLQGKSKVQKSFRRGDGPAVSLLMQLCSETENTPEILQKHVADICAELALQGNGNASVSKARQHWAIRVCTLSAALMSAERDNQAQLNSEQLVLLAPEDAVLGLPKDKHNPFLEFSQSLASASLESGRARHEMKLASLQAEQQRKALIDQKLAEMGARARLGEVLSPEMLDELDHLLSGDEKDALNVRSEALGALVMEGARRWLSDDESGCVRILADAADFSVKWKVPTAPAAAQFAIAVARGVGKNASDTVLQMGYLLENANTEGWMTCALSLSKAANQEGLPETCSFLYQAASGCALNAGDQELSHQFSLAAEIAGLCSATSGLDFCVLIGSPFVAERINHVLAHCKSTDIAARAASLLHQYHSLLGTEEHGALLTADEVLKVHFWATILDPSPTAKQAKGQQGAAYSSARAILSSMDSDCVAEAVLLFAKQRSPPPRLVPLLPQAKEVHRLSHTMIRKMLSDAVDVVRKKDKNSAAYATLSDALWHDRAKALDRAIRAADPAQFEKLMGEGVIESQPAFNIKAEDTPEHWLLARPRNLAHRLQEGGLSKLPGTSHKALSLALQGLAAAEAAIDNEIATKCALAWQMAAEKLPQGVNLRALSGGNLCVQGPVDADKACKEIFKSSTKDTVDSLSLVLNDLRNAGISAPKSSCAHISLGWKLVASGASFVAVQHALQCVQPWERAAFSLAVAHSMVPLPILSEDESPVLALGNDHRTHDNICQRFWYSDTELPLKEAARFLARFLHDLQPIDARFELCLALLESVQGAEASAAAAVIHNGHIDQLIERCCDAKRENNLEDLAISGGIAASLVAEGALKGKSHADLLLHEIMDQIHEATSSLAIRILVSAGSIETYDRYASHIWCCTGSCNVIPQSIMEKQPWLMRLRIAADAFGREKSRCDEAGIKTAAATLRDAFIFGLDDALSACTNIPSRDDLESLWIVGDGGRLVCDRKSKTHAQGSQPQNDNADSIVTASIQPLELPTCPIREEETLEAMHCLVGTQDNAPFIRVLFDVIGATGDEDPPFKERISTLLLPYVAGCKGLIAGRVTALRLHAWLNNLPEAAAKAEGLCMINRYAPSILEELSAGMDEQTIRISIVAAALESETPLRIVLAGDLLGMDPARTRLDILKRAIDDSYHMYTYSQREEEASLFGTQDASSTDRLVLEHPWSYMLESAMVASPPAVRDWMQQVLPHNFGGERNMLALIHSYVYLSEDEQLNEYASHLSKFLEIMDVAPSAVEAEGKGIWLSISAPSSRPYSWVPGCLDKGVSLLQILATAKLISANCTLDDISNEFHSYVVSVVGDLQSAAAAPGGPRARAAAGDAALARTEKVLEVLGDTIIPVSEKQPDILKLLSTNTDMHNLQHELRLYTWQALEGANVSRIISTRLQAMLAALIDKNPAEGRLAWSNFRAHEDGQDIPPSKSDTILEKTRMLLTPCIPAPLPHDMASLDSASVWFANALQAACQDNSESSFAALATVLRIAWKYGDAWEKTECFEESVQGGLESSSNEEKHHVHQKKVHPCATHKLWMDLLQAALEHHGTNLACSELDLALALQSQNKYFLISLLDGKDQTRLLSLAWRQGRKDAALVMALLAPQTSLHTEAVKRALLLKSLDPVVLSLFAFRGVLGKFLAAKSGASMASCAMKNLSVSIGTAAVVAAAAGDGIFSFAAVEAMVVTRTNVLLATERSALKLLKVYLTQISSNAIVKQTSGNLPRDNFRTFWKAIADMLPEMTSRALTRLAELPQVG